MTDPLFGADDEANTPIDADERADLIPTYVTTRDELNEAEQINIEQADRWAFARRRAVLDVDFLKNLHRRMLGDVWRWAGKYRTTGKTVGIDAFRIDLELHALVDDVRYWIANNSFPRDEIAVRFHHRLVQIHPFSNGNGRHGRLAADLLIVRLGGTRFSWGRESLVDAQVTRQAYMAALRAADGHDIQPLLAFARS